MTDELNAAIAVLRRLRAGESPFADPALRDLFAAARRADAHGLGELVAALVPEQAELEAILGLTARSGS